MTTAARLVETARMFRPQILAEHERIEAGRRLPEELGKDLGAAGFFRISLPQTYGGLDLTPSEGMEVYEELAWADASVAWCVWNANTNWTTARLPTETAREVFADPTMFMANSTRPSGRATVVDGGYQASGRWSLVSGCQLSSWLILLCIVHEEGKPRLNPAGAPENRFMLVPTSACAIVDTWMVGGLRGTGSHDVVVEDLFVPTHFASFHSDPFVLTDSRYTMPPITRIAPSLGMLALGIARSAMDGLIALANGKRHERTSQPIYEDRGAQTRLAQAEALVRSARLFLLDTVGRLWDDVVAGQVLTNKQRAEARLAAYHAVTSAAQAVDLIYQAGGATSLYVSSPIERAFRDVHAVTQHIAVHPRILEPAGRALFGIEPDASTPGL